MVQFMSVIVFIVHLLACAWAYCGLNWTRTEGKTSDEETTWILAGNGVHSFVGYDATRLYSVSLYVAVVAMFGGVGSVQPQNYAEYNLYCLR